MYFSSVPEETPTNVWLNRVAPLVAESQWVQTNYTAPASVTLGGRDISGLPLTFEIVESPRAGILSGTVPNLTYTPFENFSGYDGFTFTTAAVGQPGVKIYLPLITR
ncbi:MAG: hypothetical protein OHK0052_26980 [Anaerolineales bacterium]